MNKIFKLTLLFLLVFNSIAYADFTPPSSPYDDPPDANTLLQCSFDEADGSTTTDDESANNFTLTNNGNVQTDSAQTKFSNTSLFDGTGDWWSIADNNAFTWGSSDYTVDFWMRVNTSGGYQLGHFQDDTNNYWWVRATATGAGSSMAFRAIAGGVAELYFDTTATINTATWYHVAFARSVAGNAGYIWLDGVSKTVTLQDGAYNNTLTNLTGTFYIGQRGFGTAYDGWMDELRLSNVLRDWAPEDTGSVMVMFVKAFNPNLLGSPAWTMKIKILKWWKNLTWDIKEAWANELF